MRASRVEAVVLGVHSGGVMEGVEVVSVGLVVLEGGLVGVGVGVGRLICTGGGEALLLLCVVVVVVVAGGTASLAASAKKVSVVLPWCCWKCARAHACRALFVIVGFVFFFVLRFFLFCFLRASLG